jgi:hypothetical protein
MDDDDVATRDARAPDVGEPILLAWLEVDGEAWEAISSTGLYAYGDRRSWVLVLDSGVELEYHSRP